MLLTPLLLLLSPAVLAWHKYCPLTDQRAQEIADGSAIYISHTDVALANATAQTLFAPNIVEFGDSINSLRGDAVSTSVLPFHKNRQVTLLPFFRSLTTQPSQLGTQVENGAAKYIAETLGSPPIPVVTTLGIVHDCTQMVWFWEFDGIGTGQYRVRGMTFIHVNDQALVDMQNVEFNSLAWGADIGFQITPASIPGKK